MQFMLQVLQLGIGHSFNNFHASGVTVGELIVSLFCVSFP
jgi:hypothetical protein